MKWKNILKEEQKNPIKLAQKLVKDWKPETEEGKQYQQDLEQVVAPYCPEGSEWCTQCKQCESKEESQRMHEGEQ
jgi:hypothetical protein